MSLDPDIMEEVPKVRPASPAQGFGIRFKV